MPDGISPEVWQLFAASMTPRTNPYRTPGELARVLDPATVSTPALELIDELLLEVAEGLNDRLMISVPPQEGKALALDTPLATPTGWTSIGEIQPGDRVFDRYGEPCTVTWVSPIWRDRPCYEVRTGDGERIVADAAHEWVARLDRRCGEYTFETTVLARKRSKNAQVTGPVDLNLPEADLPLDPYVLGAWLGDGHTAAARITLADLEIVGRIRDAGVPCRKASSRYGWSLAPGKSSKPSPVRQALVSLGVWADKHIPVAYLRGSTKQRLALLQGLVDTDGYVSPKGQVEFTSTNERLALDVAHLVFTLGAKATIGEGRATIGARDCGPKWRVKFYLASAAHLSRKAERCKDSSAAHIRYTWAIPTESVPVRCIEVDSPTHTYLAGRSLLPTHNSTRISRRFPLWLLLRDPNIRVAIASYEHGMARRWGRAIRNDIKAHPELGLAVKADTSAAHEWQLDGHEGGVYCVGIGGALTGRPVDVLIIDDPVKGPKEADSPAYRDLAWDWWETVGSTRLSPGAPAVVVMTRWHEDDLVGRLLREEPDNWKVCNIPAVADHRPEYGEVDPLGREPGVFMASARRRTLAQWRKIRHDRGTRVWTALYQGRPAPGEGLVFKREWWRRYDYPQWVEDDGVCTALSFDEVVQSWDMAFKDTDGADYVVGQVWGRRGDNAFLLDQVRGRLSFVDTCMKVRALTAKWPQASAKLVEDKANGTAVINQLSSTVAGMIPVQPDGSKVARASAISPFVEAGNVYLPAPEVHAWVEELVEEAASFPLSVHDDQVDALSQALNRLLLSAVRPRVRFI